MESVKKFQGSVSRGEELEVIEKEGRKKMRARCPRSLRSTICNPFIFASICVYSRFKHLSERVGAAGPRRPTGIEEVASFSDFPMTFSPIFDRRGIFGMLSADLRRFAS
jgi:hypothetical protein